MIVNSSLIQDSVRRGHQGQYLTSKHSMGEGIVLRQAGFALVSAHLTVT